MLSNEILVLRMTERGVITYLLALIALSMFLLSCNIAEEPSRHRPLVYLNHAYVCLDSTTYHSVKDSEWLREIFAFVETKTTKANSEDTWTGTYIYGKNTYIEFFDIGSTENQGWSGIGFGVEAPNGIDALHDLLIDKGVVNISKGIRTRKVEDLTIPWFHYLGFTKEDSTATAILNTWSMEYLPNYVKYKYPDVSPDEINITRELYNKKNFRRDLMLENIIEIELALDEMERLDLFEELMHYGYILDKRGDETIAKGPDIVIVIRARATSISGICRIKFSLIDKQYEPQTISFGDKSRLILHTDRTADWHFDI
jgi:hypothetical protein